MFLNIRRNYAFLLPLAGFQRFYHRNLRTRGKMSSQNGTISLVKQGKFKVGVAPADGLGRLPLKNIFVYIKCGSLAMSAGANAMIFGQFGCPACINALEPIYTNSDFDSVRCNSRI
jgi:hypothetical protein